MQNHWFVVLKFTEFTQSLTTLSTVQLQLSKQYLNTLATYTNAWNNNTVTYLDYPHPQLSKHFCLSPKIAKNIIILLVLLQHSFNEYTEWKVEFHISCEHKTWRLSECSQQSQDRAKFHLYPSFSSVIMWSTENEDIIFHVPETGTSEIQPLT